MLASCCCCLYLVNGTVAEVLHDPDQCRTHPAVLGKAKALL